MLIRLLAYLQKLKYLLKLIDWHLRKLTHLRSLRQIDSNLQMLTGSRWLKPIRLS